MIPLPVGFMSSGPDKDATNYIDAILAAGGSLTSFDQYSINTLFSDLKAAGLYSKIDVMYPFMGGNAAANAINAKNNPTYNLTFNGTWFHNALGSRGTDANGNTSYANTNWSLNDNSTDGDLSLSMYQTYAQAYFVWTCV